MNTVPAPEPAIVPSNHNMQPNAVPLLDAAALRAAGRTPPAPFRVRMDDGRELLVLRLLRVLPGKRVVGEGRLDGAAVLAKLFIDRNSARHWGREQRGIVALTKAGVPTPDLVLAAALPGGGHVLLSRFLDQATTVLDDWRALPHHARPGNAAAIALLAPAFALLGRAHAAGLSHDDLHLGNFLRHDGAVLLIDGDAVRDHGPALLTEKIAARDLAMLIAQLPRTWDGALGSLLVAYQESMAESMKSIKSMGSDTFDSDPIGSTLAAALQAERAWRLRDYLDKTGRDCSLFRVSKRFHRFEAVVRSEAATLSPLLDAPDHCMESATILKRGNTCTVARVALAERTVVVKRYNLKSLRHALSRLWRPSRGWHSWREAHRLRLFGISTPAPLALIEERWGPLRGRAWLVTAYCAGRDLLTHLDPERPPPPAEAAALQTLFATLHRERISHGDLKATNLLWDDGEVQVIDLDAMSQHRSAARYARAWQRDRKRLLRNWPAASALHQWLDQHLPPP